MTMWLDVSLLGRYWFELVSYVYAPDPCDDNPITYFGSIFYFQDNDNINS